jgi:hypothetical protein
MSNNTPAFPGLHPSSECRYKEEGMTLRDYFAAKALQGICASGPTHEWSNSRLAAEAYDLADAMMEARNAAQ